MPLNSNGNEPSDPSAINPAAAAVPGHPASIVTAAMGILDDQKLKRLYEKLLWCRMIAEQAGPTPDRRPAPGGNFRRPLREAHEAMIVGALSHLLPEDCVASSRPDLLCEYMKGASLKTLRALLAGKSGKSRRKSSAGAAAPPEVNVIAPVLTPASAAPVIAGVGVALTFRRKRLPLAVVAFSFDNPDAQSPWRESVRFSALHKLPIVHIVRCDWPGRRKIARKLPSVEEMNSIAQSFELPAITVDASDAVAIYRITFEAARRAREGHGPTLITCVPCESDARKTARTQPSRRGNRPAPHDPLLFMENYLRQKGLWTETWKESLTRNFQREWARAAKRF